ncbi:MAG: LacI family DNA-binding transcriptional regulator [Lachnospiraceae bacterium]|nr:LacI family DNA-binding transcriptional regulator [Lachnospiraceae bacterium]MBR3684345.1 LacI family DNA-binding transcriptional regulator [Lachnospiraceae bacterium]
MSSIKDVAKHAGVAISTVSKVLNCYPNVSEDTKKRVNDAIRELNYVPNTIAAALSSKQTGRFAILINLNTQTQAIDEINMQYLSGAMNKARELKLDVITIFYSMLQDKSLDEIIVYLKSQSIAGIIIYQMSKDDTVLKELIDSQEFKIVVVDSYIVNENTSSVWVDQARAQYDVAKKAIEGSDVHNILYIAGKENGFVTEERIKGIKQLAKDLNYELRIEKGEFSELQARNITMQYGKDYDVIVCASDLMAIGAMNALTEMDVYHPVCGFDGITLMGYVGKQMHTVKQNFSHVSGEAVIELRELLNGGVGRNVVLDYELVRLKYEDIIC